MFGSKVKVKLFEKDILFYESFPVQKGRILLYGDSTFTRCSHICCDKYEDPDIEKELLGKDGAPVILNHGFGSSCADDLLYYYSRMVLPYEPKALLLSVGGNDFAHGYSPLEVMEILGRIVDYAQADFPGMPVYLLSYGPSLRELGLVNGFTCSRDAYNEMLDIYCANKPGCTCLRMQDVPFLFNNPASVGGYEDVRKDVFCSDGVHFNAKGYQYFFEYLREKLDDLL